MKFKFKSILTKIKSSEGNLKVGITHLGESLNNSFQEKNILGYLAESNKYYEEELKKLKKDGLFLETEGWIGIIILEKVYLEFIFSNKKDRHCQAEISRKSLIELMKRWNEFLKREPDLDYEEVIELPDEENPTVYSEAFFGTFETFLGNYKNDLLFTAFFNTDMGEKCKIINFLINQGFSIDEFKDENLFIFLFDGVIRGKEDVEDLLEISKLLLGKKVDISRIEKHTQKTIFSMFKRKLYSKNIKLQIINYFSKAIFHLSKAIARLSKAISHLSKAISHLSKAISHLSKAISHLSKAISHLSKAISRLSKAISRLITSST